MSAHPLSPIDHIFTGVGSYPIEFVFAYDGTIDEERLLGTLEETLLLFPPARSQLVRTSDHTYGFEPSDDGIHFETVASSVNFDDEERRHSYIDPVDSVENEPLTRIRLTQTPRGSVLGVSMSHAVVDGFSYFYFLSTWARVFHEKRVLEPVHNREVLLPAEAEHDGPMTRKDILDGAGLFWEAKRDAIARDRLVWETRTITRDEMSVLLAEAQKDTELRLSHNDVITASLWKEYIGKWTSPDGDETTYISCPVDFRRILKPFAPNYFGCAVSLATTTLEYDHLMDAPLVELALKVRANVAGANAAYVWRSLATLEAQRQQEGLGVVEEMHVIHPHGGLLVTNLSRLPVKEIEFDAGPPVAYEILTPAPRGAVVLPGHDGVEIRVCCPTTSA
jgi:shikimate O-hydroxycinnamoyltransferase